MRSHPVPGPARHPGRLAGLGGAGLLLGMLGGWVAGLLRGPRRPTG